jgi:hypothetical protein
MTLLKRKRILVAKTEATAGTAETLGAGDAAYNVYDLTVQHEIEKTPREGQGSFGHLSSTTGGHKGRITFKTDLGWDGTATEPGWADTFFPACGWVKATNTFTPRSEAPGANVKTLTMAVYEDGRRKQLRGCMGTFKLVCDTGKQAMIEWDFTGIWETPTDVTLIAPTYPTVAPLRYASGVTTFNSVALQCQNVTLDSGNTVYLREGTAANNISGYLSAVVTNRRPLVTCNPEAKLIGTQDRYLFFRDSTPYILTFEIAGPTSSKIVVSAPVATIENIQGADRESLITDELTFLCGQNGSTPDQEVSIVFTP